jgi:MinD-like ATPase involved in chromosome partitioning or flagellar assembly
MIITFYSFKGGVGRSMAAVNVAEVFAQAGLRALLVDFDLEAPSLDTYYPESIEAILDSLGIVDLVHAYKRAIASPGPLYQTSDSQLPFEDIRRAIVTVRHDPSGGCVYLMPCGRRSNDHMSRYAAAVHTLDWRDLYENWEGELYFRWLRQQFYSHADVTLVDCRAGISDIVAVCCGQIADLVVLLCAANVQQVEGSKIMASRLQNSKLAQSRGEPLRTIVVPARTENAEVMLLHHFRTQFDEKFGPTLPIGITSEDLWEAAIPFVPYFSSGTKVAVREQGAFFQVGACYRRLAQLLSRIAPEDSPLSSTIDKIRPNQRTAG